MNYVQKYFQLNFVRNASEISSNDLFRVECVAHMGMSKKMNEEIRIFNISLPLYCSVTKSSSLSAEAACVCFA